MTTQEPTDNNLLNDFEKKYRLMCLALADTIYYGHKSMGRKKTDLETQKIDFDEVNKGLFDEITLGRAKTSAHLHEIIQFDVAWILSTKTVFCLTKNKHSKMTRRIYVTNTVSCLEIVIIFFFGSDEFFRCSKAKTIFWLLLYGDLSKAKPLKIFFRFHQNQELTRSSLVIGFFSLITWLETHSS